MRANKDSKTKKALHVSGFVLYSAAFSYYSIRYFNLPQSTLWKSSAHEYGAGNLRSCVFPPGSTEWVTVLIAILLIS